MSSDHQTLDYVWRVCSRASGTSDYQDDFAVACHLSVTLTCVAVITQNQQCSPYSQYTGAVTDRSSFIVANPVFWTDGGVERPFKLLDRSLGVHIDCSSPDRALDLVPSAPLMTVAKVLLKRDSVRGMEPSRNWLARCYTTLQSAAKLDAVRQTHQSILT